MLPLIVLILLIIIKTKFGTKEKRALEIWGVFLKVFFLGASF